jgi:hypothetical protein
MNPVFKDVFEKIQKLTPEAQSALATEMAERVKQLWLAGELRQREVMSRELYAGDIIGREPSVGEVFEHLAARYGR